MAQLYADENFDARVVVLLRALGHDVLTAQQAGHANQGMPDHLILAAAIGFQRAVLTFDRRDFLRLHRSDPVHFGIIASTRDDRDPVGLAQRIHDAIVPLSDLRGRYIRIVRPSRQATP